MDPTSNYVIRLEQLGTVAEHSEKEFQFRWNLTAVDLSSGLLVAKGAGLGCGYQKQRLASSTHRVCHLLYGVTHAPGPAEGCADLAPGRAGGGRADRRDAAHWCAPSPLRSRGGLIVRRCFLAPDIRSATDLNAAGGDVARLDAIGGRSDVPLHNRTHANYAGATTQRGLATH